MTNKPTRYPVAKKGEVYDKLPHRFDMGQEVQLPGTRIRSPHYKNQFAYNATGAIEDRGWSKPVAVNDKKITEEDGRFWWARKMAHLPMYKVKGRWYHEGKNSYGVAKL